MQPKNLSREYGPTDIQPTPSPISITQILIDLKAIISRDHREEYDIKVDIFDDKTGMTLQDIFNLAVFSSVEYLTKSRMERIKRKKYWKQKWMNIGFQCSDQNHQNGDV